MNYPKIGIITGALLVVIALVGYFGSGMQSITALIPSFFGVPIILASAVALKPEKLKLGMHIAAVFGLLGFLAPMGRVIPKILKGEFALNMASVSMLAMILICGAFVVVCIKSFIDARRDK